MTDDLRFNNISGRWEDDNERLCAMELHLRLKRFPSLAGQLDPQASAYPTELSGSRLAPASTDKYKPVEKRKSIIFCSVFIRAITIQLSEEM